MDVVDVLDSTLDEEIKERLAHEALIWGDVLSTSSGREVVMDILRFLPRAEDGPCPGSAEARSSASRASEIFVMEPSLFRRRFRGGSLLAGMYPIV